MNQNPELLARDQIEHALLRRGWIVQSYKQKNIAAGLDVAIREHPPDIGAPNYILFVNKNPVGVIRKRATHKYI